MSARKAALDEHKLRAEARQFANALSSRAEPRLFGVSDGKAIGTHIEQRFRDYLDERFSFEHGNAAKGIDFPHLNIDVKVTSARQPQSSSPFASARQKVFGLGYSLLLFVYEKTDSLKTKTANLNIIHTVYIETSATGDYTLTKRIREMISDGADEDDIVSYLMDRNLPAHHDELYTIAQQALHTPPTQGYLTISNALQWRLQYGHVLRETNAPGIFHL